MRMTIRTVMKVSTDTSDHSPSYSRSIYTIVHIRTYFRQLARHDGCCSEFSVGQPGPGPRVAVLRAAGAGVPPHQARGGAGGSASKSSIRSKSEGS